MTFSLPAFSLQIPFYFRFSLLIKCPPCVYKEFVFVCQRIKIVSLFLLCSHGIWFDVCFAVVFQTFPENLKKKSSCYKAKPYLTWAPKVRWYFQRFFAFLNRVSWAIRRFEFDTADAFTSFFCLFNVWTQKSLWMWRFFFASDSIVKLNHTHTHHRNWINFNSKIPFKRHTNI